MLIHSGSYTLDIRVHEEGVVYEEGVKRDISILHNNLRYRGRDNYIDKLGLVYLISSL